MGAYKQFLTSDIIVAPLEVYKGFTFYGNSSTIEVTVTKAGSEIIEFFPVNYLVESGYTTATDPYPGAGVNRLLGRNITSYLFSTNRDINNISYEPTTGLYNTPPPTLGYPTQPQYQRLVYNSIQELYYSNYNTCQFGDPDNLQILIPGLDTSGDRYVGSANSQAHYENYLQTTLTYPRFFPTSSNARIGVVSIPNKIFGDYIQPNSFYFSVTSGSTKFEFRDDGEGNLRLLNSYYGTSSAIVGNIIYPHGIITLTGNSIIYYYMDAVNAGQITFDPYAVSIYGNPSPTYVYGTYLDFKITDL